MSENVTFAKENHCPKRVFRLKDGDLLAVNATCDNGVVRMIYATIRTKKGTVRHGVNVNYETFMDMVDHEIDLSPFKDKIEVDLKVDLDPPLEEPQR